MFRYLLLAEYHRQIAFSKGTRPIILPLIVNVSSGNDEGAEKSQSDKSALFVDEHMGVFLGDPF